MHHRQTMLILPDTDHMKAVVRVPENRVSLLRPGMFARLEKPVEGFVPLRAKVEKISVLAESGGSWYDNDSRDYPVDLVLERTPPDLKPGLKVQATVFVERMKDVLAVPLSCVYSRGESAFVFVRDAASDAGVRPVEIDLGRANATHAHVVGGLAGGEDVLELRVGEGRALLDRFGIKDGPDRNAVPRRADPEPAADSPTIAAAGVSPAAGG